MKFKVMLCTALISSAISSMSFAFFCPTNFNNIQMGDPIAKVLAQCGTPDHQEIMDPPDNQPQEWSYFLPPQNTTMQIPTAAQGTLKTTIAFDGTGKVVNISVNNIGVSTMSNCGRPISLGESREVVESTCGKPTLINKANQGAPAAAPEPGKPVDLTTKQVEFTYNSSPPITLVFLQGVLTERR